MTQTKDNTEKAIRPPYKDDGSALINSAVQAASNKKANEIVLLDLKEIEEAVVSYFVICTANNPNQMQAIFDNIKKDILIHNDEKPYHQEYGKGWSLLDYANVVVHIFTEEERAFYDLEGLWLDAKRKNYPIENNNN